MGGEPHVRGERHTMSELQPETSAAPVFWKGTVPEKCDICRNPFRGVIIDGRVQGTSRNANMHPGCHRTRGVGLGPGRGQMFRLQSDGRWLLTNGGMKPRE